MTQQRAIETRTDLLAGAAKEFTRHGYAAASVNNMRTIGCRARIASRRVR